AGDPLTAPFHDLSRPKPELVHARGIRLRTSEHRDHRVTRLRTHRSGGCGVKIPRGLAEAFGVVRTRGGFGAPVPQSRCACVALHEIASSPRSSEIAPCVSFPTEITSTP